jgi:hypothetical protein
MCRETLISRSLPACLLRATRDIGFAYADGALHECMHCTYMTCVLQYCCKLHQIAVDRTGKLTRGDIGDTAVMADIAKTNSPVISDRAAQQSLSLSLG